VDPQAMTPEQFYRYCLAAEVRDRAPELADFADRIEALPDDDPRLVDAIALIGPGDNHLDMLTADEFLAEVEPFLDDQAMRRLAEGAKFGPDFTHRFMSDPAAQAQVVGIIAEHLPPSSPNPRTN
jgi:hypothetical protein